MTIQWRFEDAEPWYVRIDNGTPKRSRAQAPDADLTLETTWGDWVDISVRGTDPRRAMLRRKLRPRGSLRTLWRMQRIFPRGA